MRPKSMATVVSALVDRVSSVMSFSVDSTVISLIVRIRVVLPAENGPVTTIFTAWALPPLRPRLMAMSQPPHAGDETQQEALIHAGIPFDLRLVVEGIGGGNRRGGKRAAVHPCHGGPCTFVGKLGAALRHERFGPGRGDRCPGVGNEVGGDPLFSSGRRVFGHRRTLGGGRPQIVGGAQRVGRLSTSKGRRLA